MKNIILRTENLSAFFGKEEVIKKVSVSFERNKVTAIMGPSGCGKTTLIRTINRMHELTAGATISGKIYLNDEDVSSMNPILVRRKIGMVFQRPNPFPTMSIFENVIAGYKLNSISLSRDEQNSIVGIPSTRRRCGTRSKTSSTARGRFFPAGNSSGFASPARSP